MLLTISTTRFPATDLGYLLHKHPDRLQSVDLSIGQAHIFYPDSSVHQSTVALLLDIDPVAMVRGAKRLTGKGFALGHYVNDRPYVASSLMSVAISKAFSTAMNGKCSAKPDLVDVAMPLQVKIAVLPAPKGGEVLIRKLFEPLGYQVSVTRHGMDETFADWGASKYFTLELIHKMTVRQLLTHLYVLIPVLDHDKHYFISQDEIEKLLQKGQGWLSTHPEKQQITSRYLLDLHSLSRQALERLTEPEDSADADDTSTNEQLQRKQTLQQTRLALVLDQLKQSAAETVIDLGCGEGKLLRLLLKDKQFTHIAGMDVSYGELLKAKNRLHWDDMAPAMKNRITLFQGALTYRDRRLEGFDAAALVEVIEHLDENRLPAFERVLFEFARPKTIIITTPNREYNVLYDNLPSDSMRHTDHRFEWTRAEFENWALNVADRHHYQVRFLPVGEETEQFGAPSQMGVFSLGNQHS